MSTAELELQAPEFVGVPAAGEARVPEGGPDVAGFSFAFATAGRAARPDGASALRAVDPGRASLPGPARPVRLETEVTEGSWAVEVPLRVDRLGPGTPPRFRLGTPPGERSTEAALWVDMGSGEVELDLAARLTDRPIDEALSYARFLRALNSEGTLRVVLLDAAETPFAQMPLPMGQRSAQDVAGLEWAIRFFERLRKVGEATGTEMLSPPDVTDEELITLELVEAVMRSGWLAQRLAEFTAWLSPEGARLLLKHGREVVEGLSLTSEDERVPLFGREISLGSSTRWVAKARLETPLEDLERRMADLTSDPEAGIETRWVPLDGAPVHVFFEEWPKPSLERVDGQIRGFEREHGMSSRTFKRAWDEGKPRALRVEGGDAWAALLEVRDHMRRAAERAGRETAR